MRRVARSRRARRCACAVAAVACRARRTSAAACRCACPSPGRGCSRRAAAGRVPARLPEALRRRRARRGALEPRAIEVGFVGSLGSPVNPGITTSAVRRLPRPPRARAATPPRASARTSAACRPRAAARGARPRTTPSARQADRPPREADRRAGRGDAAYVGTLRRERAPRCARRTRSGSTATRRRRRTLARAVQVVADRATRAASA